MKKLYFILSFLLINLCCFSQSRYIPIGTKQVVYARDGGICQCCGSSQSLEYDHIMPFSCGGTSSVSNIQLLCLQCNRSKSNSCYCKVHNRRVGVNCCDGNPTNNSKITSSQCNGTTQKGARCKNRTKNSSGRCHLH